jgi:hypothetical protein
MAHPALQMAGFSANGKKTLDISCYEVLLFWPQIEDRPWRFDTGIPEHLPELAAGPMKRPACCVRKARPFHE